MTLRPGFRHAYAVVALIVLIAGDAVRYTLSWYGFGVVAIGLGVLAVVMLRQDHGRWSWNSLPYPLYAFLGLATLSIAWSAYRPETTLAVFTSLLTITVALALATTVEWSGIARALGTAIRIILGLSLLFELFVSIVVRKPVLPFWVDYGQYDGLPMMLYWSRNALFAGDRIQGIVGNAVILAFIAVIGLIVFAVQFASRQTTRFAAGFWMLVALVTVALTRSGTMIVALAVVAAVAVAALLLRRARTPRARTLTYAGIAAVVLAAAAVAVFARGVVLGLLGKSEDLTGRLGIWETVIGLAQQRPAFGWGWISYWAPWVEPFKGLVIRNEVEQLHAHNAWLDLWLQLGVVGVVVFAALVLSALARTWLQATDLPVRRGDGLQTHPAFGLLPLLILVAMIVQSFAESKLLLEFGLAMLALIAITAKWRADSPDGSQRHPLATRRQRP